MKTRDDWVAALFAAARDGDLAMASDALAAGANVNAVNPYNVTPLLEASGQEHIEMARYLIAQVSAAANSEPLSKSQRSNSAIARSQLWLSCFCVSPLSGKRDALQVI